jgi:uncharacterized protein (TIGR02265 family)
MVTSEFHAPPWDAPLDVNAEIEGLPKGATMKGLFMLPMVAEAQSRGVTLPAARDRYLPFSDYPLAEHARLLVESAHSFYPNLTTRRGLRKLGHAAVHAFRQATIGKVMWATVSSVDSALEAASKTYSIAVPSSHLSTLERSPGRAVVRLWGGAHCFLDSNHVGTLEGVLRASQVEGSVAVRVESRFVADYLLTWRVSSLPPGRGSP